MCGGEEGSRSHPAAHKGESRSLTDQAVTPWTAVRSGWGEAGHIRLDDHEGELKHLGSGIHKGVLNRRTS